MNKEIKYKCKKCGCDKAYAKPQGRRMGVYCADCNEWICWTTYAKMIELYKEIEVQDLNDKMSMRKIYKRSGTLRMTCSRCGCLLYNSNYPKIEGQFDLVNANYCPRCGRQLI